MVEQVVLMRYLPEGLYEAARILIRRSHNCVPRRAVSARERHPPQTPRSAAQDSAAAALSKMLTSGHHSLMSEDTGRCSRIKTTHEGSAPRGTPSSMSMWNVWPVALLRESIHPC